MQTMPVSIEIQVFHLEKMKCVCVLNESSSAHNEKHKHREHIKDNKYNLNGYSSNLDS